MGVDLVGVDFRGRVADRVILVFANFFVVEKVHWDIRVRAESMQVMFHSLSWENEGHFECVDRSKGYFLVPGSGSSKIAQNPEVGTLESTLEMECSGFEGFDMLPDILGHADVQA